MKKINFLFPLIMLLLISACRNDEETMGTTNTTTDPLIIENFSPEVKPVISSVDGQVQDTDKLPVENATVRLGDLTTTTDEYGLFSFENVTMNEKGTFITVSQNGFLDGSRRFFPREDINNKVVIEMIQENFQSSFDATAGGNLVINGSTEVTFSPNSIVNANGEVFDGEVFTTSTYLDPTANTTANRMPGNLQGVQLDLEEVSLQSFGMINVELQDENGNPLNIGEGFTATISVELPATIAANAPTEIPLWSFHETFGIWVEEGSATKVDGRYVGEVTHFSWWNCDAPFPLIELDVTLTDENGNPVANHIIALGFGTDSIACYYAYTNADGFTSGKVPANETLILQIRGICGEIIHSELIGPFSDDTSLEISIVNSSINNTEITGNLVDCDGVLVTNGGVLVEIGNLDFITTVDNGDFSFFISTCDGPTDLTITAIDFAAGLQSDPPLTGMVGTMINTGAIAVCDIDIMESVLNLTVGGEDYTYRGFNGLSGSVTPNGISIDFFPIDSLGQEAFINLFVNGSTAGDYGNNNSCTLADFTATTPYLLRNVNANAQGITFANFEITSVTPNIVGTFSDDLINEQSADTTNTVLVTGSFTIIQ